MLKYHIVSFNPEIGRRRLTKLGPGIIESFRHKLTPLIYNMDLKYTLIKSMKIGIDSERKVNRNSLAHYAYTNSLKMTLGIVNSKEISFN